MLKNNIIRVYNKKKKVPFLCTTEITNWFQSYETLIYLEGLKTKDHKEGFQVIK